MTKEEMLVIKQKFVTKAEYYKVLGFEHLQADFEEAASVIDAAVQLSFPEPEPAQKGE